MKKSQCFILSIILFSLLIGLYSFRLEDNSIDEKIISFIVNTKKQDVTFYWKDDSNKIIRSINNLKNYVESKNEELIFAMNGGMFNKDYSPHGLYIEKQKTIIPIDTLPGKGNFYLKPNGIFYITTDNKPIILETSNFKADSAIKYATQSGPMLLINGKIHPEFREGSKNLQIRNGVGILPNNKVVFAMSKQEINFYDFACYFKNLGCENALYLDGLVSRTYLPEKNWLQIDGNFGVIIAVTNTKIN
jgi:uncharacterized protein YigE (DUF2233 family)